VLLAWLPASLNKVSTPMPKTKTKQTGASIDEYLASRASADQLADCKSGHAGEACLVGFAVRGNELVFCIPDVPA